MCFVVKPLWRSPGTAAVLSHSIPRYLCGPVMAQGQALAGAMMTGPHKLCLTESVVGQLQAEFVLKRGAIVAGYSVVLVKSWSSPNSAPTGGLCPTAAHLQSSEATIAMLTDSTAQLNQVHAQPFPSSLSPLLVAYRLLLITMTVVATRLLVLGRPLGSHRKTIRHSIGCNN